MQRGRWLGLTLIVAAIGIGGAYAAKSRLKRFSAVEAGVLYRSGMLTEGQFREVIAKYGIRTVFSFTFTDDAAIQKVCDAAGVKRYFHYLAGNGVGPDDPYLRFLQIAGDPKARPILVHCSAGVQRTGGAVALYRMTFQNWPFDKAVAEMRAMGNDGNQPQIAQLQRLHDRLEAARLARRDGKATISDEASLTQKEVDR